MKNTATKTIIYSGFFTALGVLFPMIFHAFGAISGQTFLPMHIPVLIAGLLVSPVCGVITGVLSPMLSCFITNMPPVFKMPFMCIELAVYGLSSGLFSRLFSSRIKSKTASIYASLVCAQILGRLANLLCTFLAVNILGITANGISVNLALLSIPAGFIGILIQWVVIPPIVRILAKIRA